MKGNRVFVEKVAATNIQPTFYSRRHTRRHHLDFRLRDIRIARFFLFEPAVRLFQFVSLEYQITSIHLCGSFSRCSESIGFRLQSERSLTR